MNFGPKSSLPFPVLEPSSNVVDFALTIADFAVQSGIAQGAQHAGDVRPLRDAQRDDGVPAELGPRPADLRQQPLDRRARRGAGGQVQPGERRRAGLAHGPSGLARRPGCPQALAERRGASAVKAVAISSTPSTARPWLWAHASVAGTPARRAMPERVAR